MAKWIFPFPDSAITGHFGKIRTFKGAPTNPHRGTDWAPGAEKIIRNVTSGTVALIHWSNIMGWGVTIKTDDGPWYVSYHHLHCAKHGINCKGPKVLGDHSPLLSTKVGDRKEVGEPVGRIGNSGSASSGAHGHFCLSKTLKGAYSGTVYDLYKHIKAEQAKPAESLPAPKPVKVTKPISAAIETPQVIYACPHCKKELK